MAVEGLPPAPEEVKAVLGILCQDLGLLSEEGDLCVPLPDSLVASNWILIDGEGLWLSIEALHLLAQWLEYAALALELRDQAKRWGGVLHGI